MPASFCFPRFAVLVFLWCLSHSGVGVRADEQEQRLVRYLMANYDLAVRPSSDFGLPVRVTLRLSLRSLHEVDEQNQRITGSFWFIQKWKDAHLRWNASDFGGIPSIRLPASRIWTPDLRLYNNAAREANNFGRTAAGNVILASSGAVTWVFEEMLSAVCVFDLQFYPFDVSSCILTIASWTHDVFQVDLIPESEELAVFFPHTEFEVGVPSVSHAEVRCSWGSSDPCSSLLYNIGIRRRYPFRTLIHFVLFGGVLHLMSAVAFCLSEANLRIIVGISCSSASVALLVTAENHLPGTAETPLLVLYLMATVALTVGATFGSLFVEAFRSHVPSVLSPGLRKLLIGCLARIFFVASATDAEKVSITQEDQNIDASIWRRTSEGVILRPRSDVSGTTVRRSAVEERLAALLEEARRATERYERRLAETDRRDYAMAERNRAATACDRLLLLLTLVASLAVHLHLCLFLLTGINEKV